MKRSALSLTAGAVLLLAANCSKEGSSGGGQSSGGNGGATTGTGGLGTNESGGASGPVGSGGSGGSSNSGSEDGAGGSGTAGGSGGSDGSGGATTSIPRRDAAPRGGASGSGGSSAEGSGGASTANGGTSGGAQGGAAGSGPGGRTGAGGATGIGGAVGLDGGNSDSGTAPSAGCGKATTLTSARASIDVNGKTREYILALPSNYDQNHPYKLIFGWHPWGGSAQMVASGGYFGLKNQSNNQAIFVAGEGQDYQNNGLGWGNANGEDVAFYHAMLDRFRSELCIDENRIFATGFSFGAMFSFTLGCTSDSMLRAIMPMAGNTTTSGGCAAGTRSVAVMSFIGVDDTLLSGHRQAVKTYASRDGCSTTTEPMSPSWCDGLAQNYLPCTCVSYQGCSEGYPVVECEYKAGHQQAPNPGPIWDFLAQF
jgi:polyhydroxybutyrate depolymerase